MQERSRSRACSLSLCRPHLRLPWFLTGKELSSYTGVLHLHTPTLWKGNALSLGASIFSPCDPPLPIPVYSAVQCGAGIRRSSKRGLAGAVLAQQCVAQQVAFFFL